MILYTDMDPFCCSWLEELIKAGCLPKGDVLCADMTEINPESVRKYARRHWCCGIGGWPYALKLAGWPEDRPIDTASLPCQPFSVAGKQKGFADERHLWPSFRQTVSILRPATLVGEQVPQAVQLGWLDGVFDDLEELGYACGAADLCAASVGAPHIRQRLFWVANAGHRANAERSRQARRKAGEWKTERGKSGLPGPDGRLADTEPQHDRSGESGARRRVESSDGGASCRVADSSGKGFQERICNGRISGETGNTNEGQAVVVGGENGGLADAERNGRRAIEQERGPERGTADGRDNPWSASIFIPCADGKARRVPGRRVAESDGRNPGSEGIQRSGEYGQQQGDCHGCWRWEIEPALFPLAHGLSPGRVGILRGSGNAIVPQVAAEFVKAFMSV